MIVTREHVQTKIDPRFNGLRVRIGDGLPVNGFSPAMLDDIYYRLTASRNDESLIMESPDFEDVDQFYNPGDGLVSDAWILEAITIARYAQTDQRMAAMVRVLNRFLRGNEDGIEAMVAIVGKPRKSGNFAYVTVQIPFSDGQTVSMIFHSPDGDKKRIGPEDSLIAFRWLMNKRDITHVVAPENGKDVSLVSVGKRITQLLAKNHAAFVKRQKVAADEKERLETLTTEIAVLEESNTGKAARLTDLESEIDLMDSKITNAGNRVEKQQIKNADLEAEITVLRAKKNAKSVGGDSGGDDGAKKSEFAEKAIALKKEYESRPPVNNKESGIFKRRVTALAKKISQNDELAVMTVDMLATRLGMGDVKFAEPKGETPNTNSDGNTYDGLSKTELAPVVVGAMEKTSGMKSLWYDDKATNDAINKGVEFGWLRRPSTTQVEWTEKGVEETNADSDDDTKPKRLDPFWNPTRLPGEIRAALKKVQVRPVVGDIDTKTPKEFRKGGKPNGHLIMNAARPLAGDSENMWNGDFNKGRFYVAIDPNGEFSEQNIKDNRKLDGWLLAYVSEADVEAWGQKAYGEQLKKLSGSQKTDFVRTKFFDNFDGLTYPEFMNLWKSGPAIDGGDVSPFDSVDGSPFGTGPFADFIGQYQSALGVNNDVVNIKNKDGKTIGYVERGDMDAFIGGDTTGFLPVDDWQTTFSIQLQERLGLREASDTGPDGERETIQTYKGSDFTQLVATQLGGSKNQSLQEAIDRYNTEMVKREETQRAETYLDGSNGVGVKIKDALLPGFIPEDEYQLGHTWTDENGVVHEVVGKHTDGRYLVSDSSQSAGFKDIMTAEDIVSAEKLATANTEYRAKQDAEQAIIDTKEAEKKTEYENVQGFVDDKTPMQRANILKALNKNVTLDGALTTRKKFIEDLVDTGKTTSTREENKVKEMSRGASFRANQQEQDEHEKRMREAGKKTVYALGGFDVTKIEYDYANFLIGKETPDVEPDEKPIDALKPSTTGTEPDKKPEQPFLDTLNSIIAGDYQGQPDKIDELLDSSYEGLESLGVEPQYESLLDTAADILTEELKKIAEGV